MLAAFALPASSAIWLAATGTTMMSVRTAGRLIRLVLTTRIPPGRTSGSNLSIDCRFSTIAPCGRFVTGEPTCRSDSTTVQLQVPPRISGP